MDSYILGMVGPAVAQDGTNPIARQGRTGELVVQELHGKYYESCYRGSIYSGGMTLTSISNATYTTATTDATATPIVGLWNPANSGVNAVILQANVNIVMTALQATGCGGFVWTVCVGNTLTTPTTGTAPFKRNTLVQLGAACKSMAGAALTGKTNALVVLGGSAIGGGAHYNASLLGTAAGFMPAAMPSVEVFDGSLIVPPGGILALQCITTPVAHSATSQLIWEEIPV